MKQPPPKYQPIGEPDPNQCPQCGYTHPIASIVTDHRRAQHADGMTEPRPND